MRDTRTRPLGLRGRDPSAAAARLLVSPILGVDEQEGVDRYRALEVRGHLVVDRAKGKPNPRGLCGDVILVLVEGAQRTVVVCGVDELVSRRVGVIGDI